MSVLLAEQTCTADPRLAAVNSCAKCGAYIAPGQARLVEQTTNVVELDAATVVAANDALEARGLPRAFAALGFRVVRELAVCPVCAAALADTRVH